MIKRLAIYFSEMFPLQVYIPLAVISFLGIQLTIQNLFLPGSASIGIESLIGCFTLFSLSLLMRIFDEFKDFEIDKRLFPHRALVRGAVRKSDLSFLGGGIVIVMILTNLFLAWVLIPLFIALGFGFLSFKWFYFKEKISNNLFLAFFSHQPMGFLVNFYVASVSLSSIGFLTIENCFSYWTMMVVFAYFFPVSAWETARKIRAPSEETSYITYSKLLGPKLACCLPLIFVCMSSLLFLLIFEKLNLPYWTKVFIGCVVFCYSMICIRFMMCLTPKSNIIRIATEISIALIQVLLLLYLLPETKYFWQFLWN